MGELADALQDYDKAIALAPGFAVAYFNRGSARQDQGDVSGAIEDYSKAIALDPQSTNTYDDRGVVRSSQGNLADAIQDFEVAITRSVLKWLSPTTIGGLARFQQGHLTLAVSDYQ